MHASRALPSAADLVAGFDDGSPLGTFHAFALRMAQAAGEVILPHFRVPITVEDKGRAVAAYDPVTEADRAAERVIRQAIVAAYPRHGIRGEEHGETRGTEPYTWVIDPIDGTRSFILGQMHWGTLIALHDGARVVTGVVHQPFVGETFHARADGDAWWSRGGAHRVLRTRSCRRLSEVALACTDPGMFPTEAQRAAFGEVARRVRMVRYGGDCYAYCLLAMGLIDLVVEAGLKAWDAQALIPIVERAGGVLTSWTGEPCEEGGAVVACGDPHLLPDVIALLAETPHP